MTWSLGDLLLPALALSLGVLIGWFARGSRRAEVEQRPTEQPPAGGPPAADSPAADSPPVETAAIEVPAIQASASAGTTQVGTVAPAGSDSPPQRSRQPRRVGPALRPTRPAAEPPALDPALPDATRPEPAQADLAQHDLAQHDLAQHDLAQHDLAQHDAARPDAIRPDLAQPEPAAPTAVPAAPVPDDQVSDESVASGTGSEQAPVVTRAATTTRGSATSVPGADRPRGDSVPSSDPVVSDSTEDQPGPGTPAPAAGADGAQAGAPAVSLPVRPTGDSDVAPPAPTQRGESGGRVRQGAPAAVLTQGAQPAADARPGTPGAGPTGSTGAADAADGLSEVAPGGATGGDADPAVQAPAGVGAHAIDDFRRLAGVGPKVANALHAAGIHTFGQLADTDEATLREAMRAAGVRSAPTLPTWSQQAGALAARSSAGVR